MKVFHSIRMSLPIQKPLSVVFLGWAALPATDDDDDDDRPAAHLLFDASMIVTNLHTHTPPRLPLQ